MIWRSSRWWLSWSSWLKQFIAVLMVSVCDVRGVNWFDRREDVLRRISGQEQVTKRTGPRRAVRFSKF